MSKNRPRRPYDHTVRLISADWNVYSRPYRARHEQNTQSTLPTKLPSHTARGVAKRSKLSSSREALSSDLAEKVDPWRGTTNRRTKAKLNPSHLHKVEQKPKTQEEQSSRQASKKKAASPVFQRPQRSRSSGRGAIDRRRWRPAKGPSSARVVNSTLDLPLSLCNLYLMDKDDFTCATGKCYGATTIVARALGHCLRMPLGKGNFGGRIAVRLKGRKAFVREMLDISSCPLPADQGAGNCEA